MTDQTTMPPDALGRPAPRHPDHAPLPPIAGSYNGEPAYRVRCACGWVSDPYADEQDARWWHCAHVADVLRGGGPPDPVPSAADVRAATPVDVDVDCCTRHYVRSTRGLPITGRCSESVSDTDYGPTPAAPGLESPAEPPTRVGGEHHEMVDVALAITPAPDPNQTLVACRQCGAQLLLTPSADGQRPRLVHVEATDATAHLLTHVIEWGAAGTDDESDLGLDTVTPANRAAALAVADGHYRSQDISLRLGDEPAGDEVTIRVPGRVRAEVAEEIARAIEVDHGKRCPECGGKAGALKWRGLVLHGRCGAGHTWTADHAKGKWRDPAEIARQHASPRPTEQKESR